MYSTTAIPPNTAKSLPARAGPLSVTPNPPPTDCGLSPARAAKGASAGFPGRFVTVAGRPSPRGGHHTNDTPSAAFTKCTNRLAQIR
ncbi:hypothetical protein GCM10009642_40630 [Nocardiopsis metallicus]